MVKSLARKGLLVTPVEIQVVSRPGIPDLKIIGLPSKTVSEAKERLISALNQTKLPRKNKRVIINLAPAEEKKTNSHLDLAMAVGLLMVFSQTKQLMGDTCFLGELNLDGSLRPLAAHLILLRKAQSLGFKTVVVPAQTQISIPPSISLQVLQVSTIEDLFNWLTNHKPLFKVSPKRLPVPRARANTNPFAAIKGQYLAKKAVLLAIAGRHHLMLIGPPGQGKSLLAKAAQQLQPPLDEAESFQVTAIHQLENAQINQLITNRPARYPHHSLTQTAMLGGTSQFKPGEVTLAHQGLLVLDEFAEFKRETLEALRQPLESKKIMINNAHGKANYPAHFTLLATTNPCPCGKWGSQKSCTCPQSARERYQNKFSGPLRDRFHIWIYLDQTSNDQPKLAQELATMLPKLNQVKHAVQHTSFTFADETKQALATIAEQSNCSQRRLQAVQKVAQTIACFADRTQVLPTDIWEAFQLSPPD